MPRCCNIIKRHFLNSISTQTFSILYTHQLFANGHNNNNPHRKVCENCPANMSLIIVSSFSLKQNLKYYNNNQINQQQTMARAEVSRSFARSLTQKKSTVSFSSILLMCIVCCLIYIFFVFFLCAVQSFLILFLSFFLHNRHHSM